MEKIRKINQILNKIGERRQLTELESKGVLSTWGLPVTNHRIVQTERKAVEAASTIGYPVVMKLVSPNIIHKTEAGVVQLNLRNDNDVRVAFDKLMNDGNAKASIAVHGVLVEEMITEGVEIIVGMRRDEVFGPAILFGLGGIFVEVLKEVSLRVVPLTRNDALEMIQETKGYELLRGYRGARKADVESLVRIIQGVAQFSECFQSIQELDLNPVLVQEDGKGATIVDARITISQTTS
ncbi:MAG: acetate--CoA ligase family protein [Candidatus Bathyarchaeota archaeon]|nr:MAG: acetate--CoA ligase family protein [Candidatus Bathyarchaeota archaeon]